MEDKSPKETDRANASDILKSLTEGVSPEIAENAKKLVKAMKSASEEDYNALLMLLSNEKTTDADEKPPVEEEDNLVLHRVAQHDETQSKDFASEIREDHDKNKSGNFERDLNEKDDGKNSYNSDSEKLPDSAFSASSGFTGMFPELSYKRDKLGYELPNMDENSVVYQLEVTDDNAWSNKSRLAELSDDGEKQANKFPSKGDKSVAVQLEAANDNSIGVSNVYDPLYEAEKVTNLASTMDKTFTDNKFKAREGNSFAATEGLTLPQPSLKADRLADQLYTAGKHSVSGVHGEASSSDSEELPELLPNKAEDTCSEIEDGENNELSQAFPAQYDDSGQDRSIEDLMPPVQADSHTNLFSETSASDKHYPKRTSYELSSDDDHVAPSSSNSELTSTESELSDEAVPSGTIHLERKNKNGKNPDDNASPLSVTENRSDAVNDDEALHEEGCKKSVTKSVHVVEGSSSIQSTGTQTSTENFHEEHLAKEQICNTPGGLDLGGLDSILGLNDQVSSKLPFYYQPQIVMHEEKPVLVLQPVSLSSLLPNDRKDESSVENGAVKTKVPIILPLASPDIDKATKDAILKQINDESEKNSIEDSLIQGYSSTVSSSPIAVSGCDSGKSSAETNSVVHDLTEISGKPVADTSSKIKNEGLPEWVPSCQLDRAFSAVPEHGTASTAVDTSATLTFPRVSLPSTNPFAKDLAVLQSGQSEGRVEVLSNLSSDKALQKSLFGPPSLSSVASGARPKQMKVFQEAGHNGTAKNPFTPDLTPVKRRRRQEQSDTEYSNAVVVSAEVHPSVSQPGTEMNRPPPRSPRPRLSSESMVTVIETTFDDTPDADTPESLVELPSPPNDEPNKRVVAQEDPNAQLKSKETQPETTKTKLSVPGKVAPLWVPDVCCSNCTHCNAKFTVFLRKHHCRACGKIFCKSCCSQLASFPYMEHKIGRVCPSCTEALREVYRAKKSEKMLKQTSSQQTPPRKPNTPISQTENAPQGLVMSPTPAQGNLHQQPGALVYTPLPMSQGLQRGLFLVPGNNQQLPISASSSRVMPSSQDKQSSSSKPAVSYQPMPIPYVKGPNPVLQSTPAQPRGLQQPQGVRNVMAPAVPANQPLNTMASGVWKGGSTVANKTSCQTESTFTVLPSSIPSLFHAGQSRPLPTGHPPPTSLAHSSAQFVGPHPHQPKPASAASVSSPPRPPSFTTAASPPTQKSPLSAGNSPKEGTGRQESQRTRPADGSFLASDETSLESKDFKPPLRRAGRTITWRYRTQGKSKLQEQKKSLAKDLKDLPNGVTVQAAPDLLVHVKKMKVTERNRDLQVWCYQSEGLNKFQHLEVVVMLEVKRKEEIFPEEVLRVYRGILHLASKLGNSFQHGNYLSSNDQFLDSLDDAGFIFVSSEVKPKPPGLREMQAPFLYGILVKRGELQAAMFTPSRLLLRLGFDMKSFPFPLWNCRDRKPINLGNERQDRLFHTVSAMNKYLKNSVPEAMVPGLFVVKEDNKVVLQISNSGQKAVVNLLERLVKKENQTATVPLVSDIPPYVDNCRVVVCNERGGRSVQSSGNGACTSVEGLGFLMLHLGVDDSSPLKFGGELLDDGVLVFFSKAHTQKLRQSLEEKTNCYFYLGDRLDISHFELRWVQDLNYRHVQQTDTDKSQQKQSLTNSYLPTVTAADLPAKESGTDYYAGLTTIDIRYSGYGSEINLLKEVFDDHTKILHILEGNIRKACTEPLMRHEGKMKAGEHLDLQLRVALKPCYKKWSIGPNDLPTALIRSLQMALSTVKVPVVSEGELVMSFDVSVFKQ